ncbi:MAG: hypothetical protein ABWY57_17055 [Mycetocola sp.]
MADRWERRTYVSAPRRTTSRHRSAGCFQRRVEADDARDAWKIVGFYCGLPCLAADVEKWMARMNALSVG